VWKNLKKYHSKPGKDADIFERVSPGDVNEYLKGFMPGLSANVFRTHNASVTLQAELKKTKGFQLATRVADITTKCQIHEKKYFYDSCNKEVAILCNHKRTVNEESFAKSEEKMTEKIKKAEDDLKTLERRLKLSQGKVKPKKGTDEHKFANKPADMFKRQIGKKKEQLQKYKLDKNLKLENKEVALGTSKINYMDPRITVAFSKRLELPIEKVFNKALLDKFPWAMAVPGDFVF